MSGPTPTAFQQAMAVVVGHEGGFTNDPQDSGNWTGGAVGQGQLKGTKYGISAASYPTVDIGSLTEDAALAIYKRDYWDKLYLDTADPGLALIAVDAAINNGVGAATKWLQSSLGVTADGVFGPMSQAALKACTGDAAQSALVALHAARINMMGNLSTWARYGGGWSKRLAQLPLQAAQIQGGASGTQNATA